MKAISIKKLTKYYGKTRGIEEISLDVEKGKIFGFLGANGAGKTTTIRLLMGLIKPSSGFTELLGQRLDRSRAYSVNLLQRLGFLPGEFRLYEDMTGEKFLNYMGSYYGSEGNKLQEIACEAMEIGSQDLKRKILGYSSGMKQKLAVIQAIQHDPELIIMDEPTEGLDPLRQHNFYSLLRDLKSRGKTIFMSSHNLSEVERICEEVAIVRKGRLAAVENVSDLKNRSLYRIRLQLATEIEADKFSLPEAHSVSIRGKEVSFRWRGEFDQLFDRLSPLKILDFTCEKASLDEFFITYYEQEEEK